jgi:hypothetical protein
VLGLVECEQHALAGLRGEFVRAVRLGDDRVEQSATRAEFDLTVLGGVTKKIVCAGPRGW